MIGKYLKFIRSVSIKWYGKLGAILMTSSFIVMLFFEFFRLIGSLTNAFIGLVAFMVLPPLFIIGFILILFGWFELKKETGKETKELLALRFDESDVKKGFYGSRVFRTVLIFSLFSIIFLGSIFMQMLSFMDEAEFCGTACHSVMNPEWVVYKQSPHSRVKCVECHVGEGVGALVSSKINGTWQMISVTFDLLERPIPTPVNQLRPARETCEKCHWPDKFYGNKLKSIVSYDLDEKSTVKYTTLNMKIDAERTSGKAGMHWHIAEENEVHYAYADEKRTKIVWAEIQLPDGSLKRYNNSLFNEAEVIDSRTMDCVDCHNRATHIYEDPSKAIDNRIRRGLLNRELPYFKREALAAIMPGYADQKSAMNGIANHMHHFYQTNYPKLHIAKMTEIDAAITVLQDIYKRNIHHNMNIEWGTYPSHIGHINETNGCFRCHNSSFKDDENESIGYDCTLCHSILAEEQDQPFKFLLMPDTLDPDYQKHRYLQEEFINSYIE